jgi:hypothetical protein
MIQAKQKHGYSKKQRTWVKQNKHTVTLKKQRTWVKQNKNTVTLKKQRT